MSNRGRGYAWEREVVNAYRDMGWHAVRLGAPSIHLPDVLAVDTGTSSAVVMECKSTASSHARVPHAQVARIHDWTRTFMRAYNTHPVIGVKFTGRRPAMMFWIVYERARPNHEWERDMVLHRDGRYTAAAHGGTEYTPVYGMHGDVIPEQFLDA